MKRISAILPILLGAVLIIIFLGSSVINTITLSSQSDVDNFNSSILYGNLVINGPDISDLSHLSVLNKITGSFSIQNNPLLINIDGLSNLDSIGGNLTISHNLALTSIGGLSKIDSVNGGLTMVDNPKLTDINFSDLTKIKGGLTIDSDFALLDLGGLSKIDSIRGNLTISHNLELTSIGGLSKIDSVNGLTMVYNPKLTEINFSDLTKIKGGLTIDSEYALLDLGGLSKIDSLRGNITITHNIALKNIDGLSNLTKFNGGLRIDSNFALMNINGLSGLSFIGGGLKIDSNYSLQSINGLSKIASINEDLTISANALLTNIDGLYNLVNVHGNLDILDNTSLSDFCGLFSLLNNGGLSGNYKVSGNAQNPTIQEIISGGPCNAENLIDDLVSSIKNSSIPKGIMNSLIALLENSKKSSEGGNYGAAINQLEALINKLEAQRGKKIDSLTADIWITSSQGIIALIPGGLAKNSNGKTLTTLNNLPKNYSLDQNYPNPFNPTTTIEYALPENEKVTIDIYDMLGRKIAELVNGEESAGYHTVEFNAGSLASGIYLYRLNAGAFSQVNKMLLIK